MTINIKRRFVVVIVCFAILFTGIYIVSVYAPHKFLADQQHEGISLVRDDAERGVYYSRVEFARKNHPPYAYSRIEYPALGTLYLTIPEFFSNSYVGYSRALSIQNLLCGFVLVLVTAVLFRQFGRRPRWLWLLATPSFSYFVLNRFDVWPALLVQLAFLVLFKHKFFWSFLLLGLAFLAKGYSIVLFPIFFIYWFNQARPARVSLWRNTWLWLVFGPTICSVIIIMVFAGVENSLFPYIYQSTRHIAHGAPYVIYFKSLKHILPGMIYGAAQSLLAFGLLGLQFALPLALYLERGFFSRRIRTKQQVIGWSLLVLLFYILFSIYYSPQWIVWLLPLAVLFFDRAREVLLVVVYDILNYLQFPVAYNYISPFAANFDMLVLSRTIVLGLLIVLVLKKLIFSGSKHSAGSSSGHRSVLDKLPDANEAAEHP